MASWRYETSLLVLKNISLVSFQHSKRIIVFPRGHVISHMYFSFQAYFLKVTGDTLGSFLRIYSKRMYEVQ